MSELALRELRPEDLDQTARLLAERGEEADATDLRLMVADTGLDSVAVVVDGERVVSTAALLDETLYLDGVAIPAGQVELVATDREYEGRGLVRRLMHWAHERSRQRGHLAQVMIGIPYFYRQFGYSYTIPMHRWRRLAVAPPAAELTDVTVRRATEADLKAMLALQEDAQRPFGLRMPHPAERMGWLVARDGSHQLVAQRHRDGGGQDVVGTARILPDGSALGELAASDAGAALALLGQVTAGAAVQERPGTVGGDAIEPLLIPAADPDPDREWYYARVPDLGALLRRLEPVLVARLTTAGLAERTHELLISSFRSHVRLTIGPDGISALRSGGPEQAPGSKGGCGVPPDALPGLVFGPHGALGLELRTPDLYLARQRDLMAALFPPVTADLLTFYLPT